MAEDDFAIRILSNCIIHEQINGRACHLVRIVNHRLRQEKVNKTGVNEVGRVDERDCRAFIEFLPYGP